MSHINPSSANPRSLHSWFKTIVLAVLLGSISLGTLHASVPGTLTATGIVVPTVETTPVPNDNDTADDPAIWIHPTDPQQSRIIGTDKAYNGGLIVYDLAGRETQRVLSDGGMNNVDLRYNFPLGGQPTTIVTASNEKYNSIAIYRMRSDGRLENIAAQTINAGMGVYGLCMYHSPVSGKYYVFVTKNPYNTIDTGEVRQWELFDNGEGKIDARLVRSFEVGSDSEGCIADDVLGQFYIAETKVGIWKYGAEPDSGSTRLLVDRTGSAHLDTELEGLSLYYTSATTGYLIVSQQCCANFVIYRREGSNEYVNTFEIVAGNGIDKVTGTDGVDVTNFGLGPLFPNGVFVAHDSVNDDSPNPKYTNFKLVPWESIANAFSPTLAIDTTWDPRKVGVNVGPSLPPSEVIFTATADARVEEANPNTNYGNEAELRVDGGNDPHIQAYLRFAVTGITGPIRNAKLRVYSTSSSSDGPSVYAANSNWSENDIVWNNRPAASGAVLDKHEVVEANSWVEYDVSAALNGNGTYSFLVDTNSSDGIRFSSREGSFPPQLVIASGDQRVFLPIVRAR